ncbi:MAG: bacterio-opsin activator domain-containing protein [Halolamina sp.]
MHSQDSPDGEGGPAASGSPDEGGRYLPDAVDTIQELLFVFSVEQGMLSWNERVTEVTGYSPAELREIAPLSLIAPAHRERVAGAISRVTTEQQAEVEADLLTKHGERIRYEFTGALLSEPGATAVLCGTGRDVSDRQRREAELRAQAERLQTLNHINAVIRDVNGALVRADSRAEIESAVCDHLAAAEPYELAWLGDLTLTGDHVEPRAKAGGPTDYVDARPVEADDGFTAVDAIDDEQVQVVQSIAEDPNAAPWREAALSRGLEAAAAVPLTYRETNYGVLCLYAPRTGAFGTTEREVLAELGETIGYAIAAAERRRALVSDRVVEVELEFAPPGPYFLELAAESAERLELEGVVEEADGVAEFFAVAGDINAVNEAAASAGGDLTVVSTSDRGGVVRVDPAEPSIAALVAHYGGTLKEANAGTERGYARLELPRGADVRTVVEAIERAYDDVRLLAQRERDRTGSQGLEFRGTFDESLTERQQQVIETAYHAGFFGWPRDASAEEVAESLDIAPPTFHEHLRRAEEKLLDAYFEADGLG